MLIVYRDDHEVIVTTEDKEKEVLKVWFAEGGRDPEEYDRSEVADEAVVVNFRPMVW